MGSRQGQETQGIDEGPPSSVQGPLCPVTSSWQTALLSTTDDHPIVAATSRLTTGRTEQGYRYNEPASRTALFTDRNPCTAAVLDSGGREACRRVSGDRLGDPGPLHPSIALLLPFFRAATRASSARGWGRPRRRHTSHSTSLAAHAQRPCARVRGRGKAPPSGKCGRHRL